MVSSMRSAARSLGLLRSAASIDIYFTGEALVITFFLHTFLSPSYMFLSFCAFHRYVSLSMTSYFILRFHQFPFFQSRFCSSSSFSSRFLEPIRSRSSKLHPSPIASPSIPPHHHTIPRVLFCSKPLDIGQDTADSSNILTEDEFHKLANQTIEYLQENLEEYGDEVQIDGFDIDYGNQVLTLKLGDFGTYVINKQTPNRQIWLSSPVSGPSRFDWDRKSQSWVYRRTKAKLLELVEDELGKLCGKPINLC